jgi:hypothetical protein
MVAFLSFSQLDNMHYLCFIQFNESGGDSYFLFKCHMLFQSVLIDLAANDEYSVGC